MGGYNQSVEKKYNQNLLYGMHESVGCKISKTFNSNYYDSLTSHDKEILNELFKEKDDFKSLDNDKEETYNKK